MIPSYYISITEHDLPPDQKYLLDNCPEWKDAKNRGWQVYKRGENYYIIYDNAIQRNIRIFRLSIKNKKNGKAEGLERLRRYMQTSGDERQTVMVFSEENAQKKDDSNVRLDTSTTENGYDFLQDEHLAETAVDILRKCATDEDKQWFIDAINNFLISQNGKKQIGLSETELQYLEPVKCTNVYFKKSKPNGQTNNHTIYMAAEFDNGGISYTQVDLKNGFWTHPLQESDIGTLILLTKWSDFKNKSVKNISFRIKNGAFKEFVLQTLSKKSYFKRFFEEQNRPCINISIQSRTETDATQDDIYCQKVSASDLCLRVYYKDCSTENTPQCDKHEIYFKCFSATEEPQHANAYKIENAERILYPQTQEEIEMLAQDIANASSFFNFKEERNICIEFRNSGACVSYDGRKTWTSILGKQAQNSLRQTLAAHGKLTFNDYKRAICTSVCNELKRMLVEEVLQTETPAKPYLPKLINELQYYILASIPTNKYATKNDIIDALPQKIKERYQQTYINKQFDEAIKKKFILTDEYQIDIVNNLASGNGYAIYKRNSKLAKVTFPPEDAPFPETDCLEYMTEPAQIELILQVAAKAKRKEENWEALTLIQFVNEDVQAELFRRKGIKSFLRQLTDADDKEFARTLFLMVNDDANAVKQIFGK